MPAMPDRRKIGKCKLNELNNPVHGWLLIEKTRPGSIVQKIKKGPKIGGSYFQSLIMPIDEIGSHQDGAPR